MTVLVGVKCTDGVVIGADSMATSTHGPASLLQTQTDKIQIIAGEVIVAGSGSVGLIQRFTNVVDELWKNEEVKRNMWSCIKSISAATITDFKSTGVPFKQPPHGLGFGFGSLLAAPIEGEARLVEYGEADVQPELKDEKPIFVSMGSGQMLAEPFVAFVSRVLWDDGVPDVQAAMFGVYWALDHTIKYAPGGVGEPIRMALLKEENREWNARVLDDDELQEKAQHINQIERRIARYPKEVLQEPQATPPPAPPPASPAGPASNQGKGPS